MHMFSPLVHLTSRIVYRLTRSLRCCALVNSRLRGEGMLILLVVESMFVKELSCLYDEEEI